MTDTAVQEPKARKARVAQTKAQKQATVLRSDAARLERLAMDSTNPEAMLATAAKLRAQADGLAPAAPKPVSEPRRACAFTGPDGACRARAQKGSDTCFSHSDPLGKLTETEWQAVEGHFMTGNFRANLLQVTSWRRLKDIATPVPA